MKVSIVSIFFNSSCYVRKCMDSILLQNGVDLELIAVDDCSQDDTVVILKQYEEKDSRVKVIRHEVNKGIATARNTGISAVTGDCFYLIDGDDYLPDGALACLSKYFSPDVDWVQGGYEIQDETGVRIRNRSHSFGVYKSHEEIAKNFGNLEMIWCHNRLINSKWKNHLFHVGIVHEDWFWNVEVYPHLNKIINVEKDTYYYIDRSTSFSKSSSCKKPFIEDGVRLLEKMMKQDDNWQLLAQSLAVFTIVKKLYLGSFTSDFRKEMLRKIYEMGVYPITIYINGGPRFPQVLYFLMKCPDWVRRMVSLVYLKTKQMMNKPL